LQFSFLASSVFLFFSTTQSKSDFLFATTHNSWLQSRTPNSCNHTLVRFLFVPLQSQK
jgi:hypothetical protein